MTRTEEARTATSSAGVEPKMTVDDVIIAAARESIMTIGLRKTSIAEISRKAGVSRPTVYRRYADISELIAEVINREILHTLEGLTYVPGNARARILLRMRIVMERIIDNGFFTGLVETDPERVLQMMTRQMGSTQLAIVDKFILPGVKHGQEDGSIRQHDPFKLSRNIFRLTQSLILTWKPLGDGAETDSESIDEVVDLVDRYLRPDIAE
nr:TetR/AcrR family transcriptional regulator [Corynebacterium lactis]